jgi:hypothetical protein
MKNIVALVFAILVATQMYVHSAPVPENEAPSDKPESQSDTAVPQSNPDKRDLKESSEQSLDAQIEHWITVLANHEEFESWQDAKWKSYPLGPGTHGWLVLVYNDKQEVGYLVVSSTPEGTFQLSEYGTGENPLFSLTKLNQTLVQHELIDNQDPYERIYINPFQAVWKLIGKDYTYYFDAITGEAFPLTEKSIEKAQKSEKEFEPKTELIRALPHLSESLLLPVFDPFEQLNWINNEPMQIEGLADLIKTMTKAPEKITYTASIFDDNILMPFALVGYHIWDRGEAYLSLDQQGLRFIPFPSLQKQGQFYNRK